MTTTRDTMHFRVVFQGRLVDGKSLAEVRESFTRKFGEKVARSVFARSNVVLKKGLDKDEAQKFQSLFESLGMLTALEEELPAGFQLSLEDEPKQQTLGAQAGGKPAAVSPRDKGDVAGRVRPRAPRNETYTLNEIRDAFRGEVTLPGMSEGYKSRLALVAVTMLMLPVIYAGLVFLSFGLALWVAKIGINHIADAYDPNPWLVLVYAALLLGLLLITAFLLKPLIARWPRGAEPVRVDPSREPVLYFLVGEITDAIGAPMPDEILLDTSVDAAAGYKGGFFGDELTLVIGLPLVWGTDVNTLTGILAHEFGHFAQKWASRAGWTVDRVNMWLHRQVCERDRWDIFVEELTDKENVIPRLAGKFAKVGSTLCRRIMGQLAKLATRISLSLTRQRELDADRYQTGLLGSDAYENAVKRLRVLAAAHQATVSDLRTALDRGKKVDNLPRMTVLRADGFTEEEIERAMSGIEEVNSSIWRTHPPSKERIRAARAAAMKPKFDFKGSSRGLLRGLDGLSQKATLQWYRSFGIPTSADDLQPIEAFVSETDALTHASESIEQYFGPLGDYPLPLDLPSEDLVVKVATEKLVHGLTALNEKLKKEGPELAGKRERLRLTRQLQNNYNHASFWRSAGLEVNPDAYQPALETTEPDAIDSQLAHYRKIEDSLILELRAGAAVLGKKLAVALELAQREDPGLANEIGKLRSAYATVAQTYDDSRALSESCVEMEMLLEACRAFPDVPAYPLRVQEEASRNAGMQERIREILDRERDPSKPGLTLANVLPERGDSGDREPQALLTDAGSIVRQAGRLGFRILGRMAEIARISELEHRLR